MILTRRFDYEKLEVKEVTLLSIEEYEAAKEVIPLLENCWWWLRSPGFSSYAASVDDLGRIGTYGGLVNNLDIVVRPALRVSNLQSLDLQIGDKIFDLAGHTWTVIADDLMLCDDGIGQYCFREDWEAEDSNMYEASDVKKYLDSWAQENRINCVAANNVKSALETIRNCFKDTEAVAYEWLPDADDLEEYSEDLSERLDENRKEFEEALAIIEQIICHI